MSQSFIGQILIAGFNFAMKDWAFCNGQLLPISQNNSLFALLGTTFGGDGVTTFGLPDLRGRMAVHQGQGPGLSNYVMGQKAGQESVTLSAQQMPSHAHTFYGAPVPGNRAVPPAGGALSSSAPTTASAATAALSTQSTTIAGASQPHTNLQPYLGMSFMIALSGPFPSRN